MLTYEYTKEVMMTFDPILIGETIKQLLKTHNMTQDQLANHLHITKSAVSQNLNGKSSFDIQNLIAIAKLFSISLDRLLGIEQEDKHVLSPYEKLVEKGLEGINHVHPKQLQLDQPDTYGKLFIEYVMQVDHMVLLNYMLTNHVSFVDRSYMRASEVTLKVLLYMMEHDIPGVKKIFDQYLEIKGSLSFETIQQEAIFFGLLDQEHYIELQQYLIKLLKEDIKIVLLKSKPKILKMNVEGLVDIITTHKLKHLSKLTLHSFDFELHYFYTVSSCVKNQDYDTLDALLSIVFNQKPNGFTTTVYNIEQAMKLLIESKQETLILKALDKHLYQDITVILNDVITHQLYDVAHHILHHFKDTLQFRKIKIGLLIDQKPLLDQLTSLMSISDLNYILSRCTKDQLTLMLYLYDLGARFFMDDFSITTFDAVNALIEHLHHKGVSS